uniref:Uncharacterized protein n=1 Tax=Arundo donax TaxID=35708 RepID=A0A0A8Y2Z4_ARUDO
MVCLSIVGSQNDPSPCQRHRAAVRSTASPPAPPPSSSAGSTSVKGRSVRAR